MQNPMSWCKSHEMMLQSTLDNEKVIRQLSQTSSVFSLVDNIAKGISNFFINASPRKHKLEIISETLFILTFERHINTHDGTAREKQMYTSRI